MVDSFTQVSVLKKKRNYNYGRRSFSAITLKALWSDKTPTNLGINYRRTVSYFVYFYTHSINEAEMIKCSSFIVDNVGGYWNFNSQNF